MYVDSGFIGNHYEIYLCYYDLREITLLRMYSNKTTSDQRGNYHPIQSHVRIIMLLLVILCPISLIEIFRWWQTSPINKFYIDSGLRGLEIDILWFSCERS